MRFDHAPASEELAKSLFGGRRVLGAFPLVAADIVKQPPFPPRPKDEDEEDGEEGAEGAEKPPADGGDWGGITLDEAERRLDGEGGGDEAGDEEEPGAEPEGAEAPAGAPAAPQGTAPDAAPGAPGGGEPGAEEPGAPAGAEPAPEGPMDEEPQGQPTPPGAAPAQPTGAGTTTVGQFLQSTIHSGYTLAADRVFGAGYLTREERIALSSAISRALQVFDQTLQQEHPELYGRTMPTEVALSA